MSNPVTHSAFSGLFPFFITRLQDLDPTQYCTDGSVPTAIQLIKVPVGLLMQVFWLAKSYSLSADIGYTYGLSGQYSIGGAYNFNETSTLDPTVLPAQRVARSPAVTSLNTTSASEAGVATTYIPDEDSETSDYSTPDSFAFSPPSASIMNALSPSIGTSLVAVDTAGNYYCAINALVPNLAGGSGPALGTSQAGGSNPGILVGAGFKFIIGSTTLGPFPMWANPQTVGSGTLFDSCAISGSVMLSFTDFWV